MIYVHIPAWAFSLSTLGYAAMAIAILVMVPGLRANRDLRRWESTAVLTCAMLTALGAIIQAELTLFPGHARWQRIEPLRALDTDPGPLPFHSGAPPWQRAEDSGLHLTLAPGDCLSDCRARCCRPSMSTSA